MNMIWEQMMWAYALGAVLIIGGFILASTGKFGVEMLFMMSLGAIIVLVNALYWAHWLVVTIIAVLIVGIYFLYKNFTVG